jgi:hypothetical protein
MIDTALTHRFHVLTKEVRTFVVLAVVLHLPCPPGAVTSAPLRLPISYLA